MNLRTGYRRGSPDLAGARRTQWRDGHLDGTAHSTVVSYRVSPGRTTPRENLRIDAAELERQTFFARAPVRGLPALRRRRRAGGTIPRTIAAPCLRAAPRVSGPAGQVRCGEKLV